MVWLKCIPVEMFAKMFSGKSSPKSRDQSARSRKFFPRNFYISNLINAKLPIFISLIRFYNAFRAITCIIPNTVYLINHVTICNFAPDFQPALFMLMNIRHLAEIYIHPRA